MKRKKSDLNLQHMCGCGINFFRWYFPKIENLFHLVNLAKMTILRTFFGPEISQCDKRNKNGVKKSWNKMALNFLFIFVLCILVYRVCMCVLCTKIVPKNEFDLHICSISTYNIWVPCKQIGFTFSFKVLIFFVFLWLLTQSNSIKRKEDFARNLGICLQSMWAINGFSVDGVC